MMLPSRTQSQGLATLVCERIEEYQFINIGVVTKVIGRKVAVTVPILPKPTKTVPVQMPSEYVNVPLINLGSNAVGITIEPKVGDTVVLLATRDHFEDIKIANPPTPETNALYYGHRNIRALQIAPESITTCPVTIKITQMGEVTIQCQQKVSATFMADVQATMQGKSDISVTGATTVNCQDKADITVGGAATVNCNDKADVTVGGAATVTCDDKLDVSASGDMTVHSDGKVALDAGGDATVTASGKVSLNASSDCEVVASGNVKVQASGNATITGAKVDINNGHLSVM